MLPKIVLLHLCVTLVISQVLFLVGINRTEVVGVCRGIAIALHYFLLSAFCWMLVEGYNIHESFTAVFEVSAL